MLRRFPSGPEWAPGGAKRRRLEHPTSHEQLQLPDGFTALNDLFPIPGERLMTVPST
jgi:hypothetical protein